MNDEAKKKKERSRDIRQTIERLQRIEERREELAERLGPTLIHRKTTPDPMG